MSRCAHGAQSPALPGAAPESRPGNLGQRLWDPLLIGSQDGERPASGSADTCGHCGCIGDLYGVSVLGATSHLIQKPVVE